jgi:HTH-type transcriptional regulator / antitoxin HigA
VHDRVVALIHNVDEYQAAMDELDRLMALDPEPGSPDDERLELLMLLIERYESEQVPIELPHPIEAIKFRMEQLGLRPVDLVPYIGSRGRVSEILSGRRALTLPMIRRLHEGLGLPVEVLIREYDLADRGSERDL